MKPIILIGGAGRTGKTTLTKRAAAHFQVPWISTDQVRDILKVVTTKESHPELFLSDEDDADLPVLFAHQMQQAETVWKGVLSLLHTYPWESLSLRE